MESIHYVLSSFENGEFFTLITTPLLQYHGLNITLLSFATTLLIAMLGVSGAKLFKRKAMTHLTAISAENRVIISNLGYYFILFLTAIISLDSIGLNLSSLAIVAGALSVGIGFGLQNIVSNFVSGIILMFEKSIRIGDFVELNATTKGRVTDIKMRATTLVNGDNIDIIVPNSYLIQNTVINWTVRDAIAKVHAPFSVAYANNLETIQPLILEAFLASSIPFLKEDEKKPIVSITALTPQGIEFDLTFYATMQETQQAKSQTFALIYETLTTHKIKMGEG